MKITTLRKASRRLGIIVAITVIAATGFIGLAVAQPNQVSAASCGTVETTIVAGDVCDNVAKTDNEAASDSSKSPLIAIILFAINLMTLIVGIAAVGAIIYASILYASAGANASQVAKAKEYIQNTAIGLIVYAVMLIGTSFLIPGGLVGPGGIALRNGVPAGGSLTYNSSGNGSGITIGGNENKSDDKTSPTPKTAIPSSLSGVKNFRDLAKYNSSLIKPGVVFRSGKLQDATAGDRSKLAVVLKNGVIIDLRAADKRAAEPDKSISGVPNLSYDIDAATGAAQYVKVFVNDASERKEFGLALTKIANTKGAVLFHCTKGKDRTGWLASMILYILGANDKQVMTEYMHSNDAGASFNVEQSWLKAALSAARKNNGGSIMTYIKSSKNGLGVSDDTIAKLRAKLGN